VEAQRQPTESLNVQRKLALVLDEIIDLEAVPSTALRPSDDEARHAESGECKETGQGSWD
jgi:hypothetical protein